jgi:transcription-repair coupling factor (superfamily II helicase)
MGLSQLHQIRGRVGRSSRQAYAYFTYRQGKALSEIATKRLKAIRDFAEFGAGFKVALRDLEIRGAGNLLGAEQHGYIDSVGYDLYVKLLNEAVLEESGKVKEVPFESTVDIKISAYIPEKYIFVNSQRMEMYKKISLINTPEDKRDVLDEFEDRFGETPREVERLLSISLVRALGSNAHISKTEYKNGYLVFTLSKPSLEIWSELFGKYAGMNFRTVGAPTVTVKQKSADDALLFAEKVLSDYNKLLGEAK